MFKYIGKFIAIFIYTIASIVYNIAFLIVRYILGIKVEYNVESFNKIFVAYEHKKDTDK